MPRPLYFNGKFYGGGLNGVHRVADRLIRECDARLMERRAGDRPETVLLAPRSSDWLPDLRAIRIERVEKTGQLWEQLVLPRRTADGVLVNLANLAPILHRFGAYLETLFGQVNLRMVLAQHPFEAAGHNPVATEAMGAAAPLQLSPQP